MFNLISTDQSTSPRRIPEQLLQTYSNLHKALHLVPQSRYFPSLPLSLPSSFCVPPPPSPFDMNHSLPPFLTLLPSPKPNRASTTTAGINPPSLHHASRKGHSIHQRFLKNKTHMCAFICFKPPGVPVRPFAVSSDVQILGHCWVIHRSNPNGAHFRIAHIETIFSPCRLNTLGN